MLKPGNYLIQFLRKSKLVDKDTDLAHYLNAVLKQLIVNNTNADYSLHIYGSCWGHFYSNSQYKSVEDLVKTVFNGVPTDIQITLCNQYNQFRKNKANQRYAAQDIQTELKKYQGFVHTFINSSNMKRDHAKIVKLEINKNEVFYMKGSSNFSKNSYIQNGSLIDQCEVAFIKAPEKQQQNQPIFSSVINLINYIIDNYPDQRNQELLQHWSNLIGLNSSNPQNNRTNNSKNILMPTVPFIYNGD